MSFTQIIPGLKVGRAKLANAVKIRSSGGSAQIVISRDIAEEIGLGNRAKVAVGSGPDAGWLAITPCDEGAPHSYKVMNSNKRCTGTSTINVGVYHIGWAKKPSIKTTDVRFVAGSGSLRLCLPRISGAETRASTTIPVTANGDAAHA
jgi:hypothetical protein